MLPVFQNQKLQEDNAKLQLDNEAAEKKSKTLLEAQKQLAQKSAQMQTEIDVQKRSLIMATRSAVDAKAREQEAIRLAGSAKSQMKVQYAELDKARWRIATNHFATELTFVAISAGDKFNKAAYSNGDGSSFIRAAGTSWPVGLNIVLEAWENAKKTSVVPPEYFQRMRQSIDAHTTELQCPKPDLDVIVNDYDIERKAVLIGVKEKANNEIEGQRLAAEKEGKRLQINLGDHQRMEDSYRLVDLLTLDRKYQEMLRNQEQKCTKIIFKFIDKLEGEGGAKSE